MKTTSGRCLNPKCKRWQSWPGRHADRPPCEACGAEPDREMGRLIDEAHDRDTEAGRIERRQRESARR